MAALTGHRTDCQQRFVINRAQRALRKQLQAEIDAAMASPLIDAALLSAEERVQIRERVHRALHTESQDDKPEPRSTRSGRKWPLPVGMSGYCAQPGPHPQIEQPHYMQRRQRLQGGGMLEQRSTAMLVKLARFGFGSTARSVTNAIKPQGTREDRWAWSGATQKGQQVVAAEPAPMAEGIHG